MKDREMTIGVDEKGTWTSIKLKPSEFELYFGIRQAFKKAGLQLSLSAVLRKVLDVGMENIDLDKLKEEPFYLFRLIEEGE